MQQPSENFPERLRWWRRRRGLSQLELAGRAEISQRHLSFLELGRAAPSRDMVLRLAAALSVPLRQSNGLLLAAGFAPAWRQGALAGPELAAVKSALDYMLAHHEPYPAVVVDRSWTLLQANRGAGSLVGFLVGALPEGVQVNLADALVGPDVLRPFLENWDSVVRHFIATVEADAASDGSSEVAALLDRLQAYPGVREAMRKAPDATPPGPVLPMHFRKDGIALSLFTTIAVLGTPQDVALQELRIESFFPMDEATAAQFRRWHAA
jgi:transcriptional regulator with XRE-family HTH domain